MVSGGTGERDLAKNEGIQTRITDALNSATGRRLPPHGEPRGSHQYRHGTRIAAVSKPKNVGWLYDSSALSLVFGVRVRAVDHWIKRGLFGEPCGTLLGRSACFTEASVVTFIRRHPREYDVATVCRPWFKAMVFGRPAEGQQERSCL